jgi:ribose transport system permease protein
MSAYVDESGAAPSTGAAPAAVTAAGAPAPTIKSGTGFHLALGKFVLPGSLAAMVLIFSLMTSNFYSGANIQNILDQTAVPLLLACGVTFVLSVGEFDLAFTAVLGLAAAVVVDLMAKHGISWQFAVLTVIPLGLIVGAVVGLLVTFGRASSFIITLAVGSALTGLELALTGNQTIYQNIAPAFAKLTSDKILGLHLPVWFALIVALLSFVGLHGTRFGRHAQSLGGNPQAAHLAGVRVRRIRIACFVISAVLASVAAVILTSRANSYYPNIAASFVLSTYTAVFLGATSGRTSSFTIGGSVLGVLWIIVLQTGLTLNGAPTWSANLIQGGVLALAVIIGARAKGST